MIKTTKFLLLVAFMAGATEVTAQDYDLVIMRGRVMDPETQFDGVKNVGIKAGKIVAITDDAITGKETLDVKGLVVTAGYKPESVEGALGLKYEEMMFDPIQNKYLTKEEYLKVVKEDPGRTVIGFNPVRKEWMPFWLKMPHMTVGSDAMWATENFGWDDDPTKYVGHPRTSGTHTKVLRMAREEKVPLMFTLAQLSYWSAKHLGDAGLESMQVRGRMQEGMVADIVVFDAEEVKEGSDYKAGTQGLPPIALPHVIVSGVFVKKDNRATGQFPGQPIRYPVEERRRHKRASQRQWLKSHSIDGGALVPKSAATSLESTAASVVARNSNPDHQPFSLAATPESNQQSWFGDGTYRSLGYCCEWHMLQARFAAGDIASELPAVD